MTRTTHRQVAGAAFVLLMAIWGLACDEEPGRFSVTLTWADGAPAANSVFLSARVEERTVANETGRVLAALAPVSYSPGMTFDFSTVPNGANRVVIVEARFEANDIVLPTFYGRSAPFTLAAGMDRTVEVAVEMRRPPAVDLALHGLEVRGVSTATVGDDVLRIREPVVVLDLRAPPSARRVLLSNQSDFSSARIEELQATGPCQDLVCAFQIDGWSLETGVDNPCVDSDFCPRQVFARLIDEEGYGSAELSAAVVLDTRGPEVGVADVAYRPDESNVLLDPDAARVGTTISVQLIASERLSEADFPNEFTASNGDSILLFTLVPASRNDLGGRFTAVVGPDAVDGVYTPTLRLVDLAGNVSVAATFDAPAIVVFTSSPSLSVQQNQVSYARSPNGSASEGVGVESGAVYALRPIDLTSADTSLPSDTFVLAGRSGPRLLRVWADADQTVFMGQAFAQPDGRWALDSLRLRGVDARRVYVSGVDGAGNESAAVGIEHVWFTATTNVPVAGPAPHVVRGTDLVEPYLQQRDQIEAIGLESPDGRGPVRASTTRWRSLRGQDIPAIRTFEAMAYDSIRGQVMVFGGAIQQPDDTIQRFDDVWEFDGEFWFNATPSVRPEARYLMGHAFDPRRGEWVLFGGLGEDLPFNETWVWNGLAWRPAAGLPEARSGSSMAYHAGLGKVVLFGGRAGDDSQFNDLWSFDGEQWTEISVTPGPSKRRGAALVYDTAEELLVLFGGVDDDGVSLNDTWVLVDGVWRQVDLGGPNAPSARAYGAMAYAPNDGRTYLTGGALADTGLFETWAWDGTSWTLLDSDPNSLAQFARSAYYDPTQAQVSVHIDGQRLAFTERGWINLGPANTFGPVSIELAAAYDPTFEEVVTFGGRRDGVLFQQTSLYDGSNWFDGDESPNPPPPARQEVPMVFDERVGAVFMYGGRDLNFMPFGDGWVYENRSWRQVWTEAGVNGPGPRYEASMVFHAGLDRVVLVGDAPRSRELDLWAWDGMTRTWTELATHTSSRPPNLFSPAVAYDPGRDMLVVFGGTISGNFNGNGDIWEYDGTEWRMVTPAIGPRPTPRGSPRMIYDPERGEVLLLGGRDRDFNSLVDVWSWNGTRWRSLVPTQGIQPTPFISVDFEYFASRRYAIAIDAVERWRFDSKADGQSALTMAVDLGEYAAEDLIGLDVNAFCAATYAPYDAAAVGAELRLWSVGGAGRVAGGWSAVASNRAALGIEAPRLPLPIHSRIEWSTFDPAEARAFVVDGEKKSFVQCRPRGSAGSEAAEVGMDFVQARYLFRLATP